MASVVLHENVDTSYEPSQREIEEYAKWIGMDPIEDESLLWLAKEGLLEEVLVQKVTLLTSTGVLVWFL